MKLIRGLLLLLIAYVLAAPLTDLISMDLTQTEWSNLWTYVIWLFSMVIWGAIATFAGILLLLVLDR